MDVIKNGNILECVGAKTGKRYQYEYVLPTLDVVGKRINNFLQSHPDDASMETIGQTRLGYPLQCIKIGHGKRDLFVVGGTHSNEIIAVDNISQFLEHFDEDFDKSLLDEVTLNIIPIQNPEGYKVLDSLMNEINDYIVRNGKGFEDFCFDYYLKYRTDSLIYLSFKEMNKFMTDENFITHYRNYIQSNEAYQRLHQDNALPKLNKKLPYIRTPDEEAVMLTFDEAIMRIDPLLPLVDYLKEVRNVIADTRNKLDLNNTHDKALDIYLDMLFKSLTVPLTLIDLNNITKLHQEMLKDVSLNAYEGLKNSISTEVEEKNDEKLRIDFGKSLLMTCTKEQVHTIITEFASNIVDGVNLNGNSPYSPGIDVQRKNETRYSLNGSISNLRNYSKDSPLGASVADELSLTDTLDEENMTYSSENEALLDLLNKSSENGTYGGCILCHGTGGELYYKPNEELTKSNYLNISEANEKLVLSMQESIDESIADLDPRRYDDFKSRDAHYYRKKDSDDKTGFGDLLRSKYPRVIMFENSVMGGNPFGPYGDAENYVRTVACFAKAIEAASQDVSLINKDSKGINPY